MSTIQNRLSVFTLLFFFSGVLINISAANVPRDSLHEMTWGGEMDPLQEGVTIFRYQLDLRLDPEEKTIGGSSLIRFQLPAERDTLRLNLTQHYEVTQVESEGENLDFVHEGNNLDVDLRASNRESVRVFYSGTPPEATQPPWSGGFVWTTDAENRHWVGFSCQNVGAKVFMPCLDHPSSRALKGADIRVEVPKGYQLVSNGRLQGTKTNGDWSEFHWNTDYPIANYNINFTMGDFERFEKDYTSVSGQSIPMQVHVLKGAKEKGQELLDILEGSTQVHERYFGPYPFPRDKIAVVHTPYLGMEHQTVNAYGNGFRFSKINGRPFDWLLHHELGHEWWGNKVSVGDWADFWIHEGICTYGDWLIFEAYGGEQAYFGKVESQKRIIFNQKPVVPESPATAEESYHRDVYSKGAYIMHTLRFLLGDEAFFDFVKELVSSEATTYEEQTSTEEFLDILSDYTEQPYDDLLDLYLYSTALPQLKVVEMGSGIYSLQWANIDHSLPLEIKMGEEIERYELGSEARFIESEEELEIDPHHWYLMEVERTSF